MVSEIKAFSLRQGGAGPVHLKNEFSEEKQKFFYDNFKEIFRDIAEPHHNF